ncbi:unnamed protein product [Leptidea sinapis]|uniref:Uncharacterized protein n=1 Tax=Leptidea sinapis TaxID=189913 RepID=A0A5E4PM06_9NEOP|nr:unnamed protein product [Leptidea sinapis]
MSVSRIHYHPEFHRPDKANRSHPLPATFDLAVWASTNTLYGWYTWKTSATYCPRATSSEYTKKAATPSGELFQVVGTQFMWAHKRKPTPFHKYFVRTTDFTDPCPKPFAANFCTFIPKFYIRLST